LRQELSLDVVPRLCRLRTVRCRIACVRDFVVLATYSSKPNTLAIPLYETPIMHWEWRDGESSVYTSCESTRSTVLSGSTGPISVLEDPSEG